jgi:hypothetical protein
MHRIAAVEATPKSESQTGTVVMFLEGIFLKHKCHYAQNASPGVRSRQLLILKQEEFFRTSQWLFEHERSENINRDDTGSYILYSIHFKRYKTSQESQMTRLDIENYQWPADTAPSQLRPRHVVCTSVKRWTGKGLWPRPWCIESTRAWLILMRLYHIYWPGFGIDR